MNLLWWIATWLGYGVPPTIADAYTAEFIYVDPVVRSLRISAVGRMIIVDAIGREAGTDR